MREETAFAAARVSFEAFIPACSRRPEPVPRREPTDTRTIRPAFVGPAQGGGFHHPHRDNPGGGNAGHAVAAGDIPGGGGLAVYPAQPSLQDKTEGRTDALTATRADSATYILQRPGDYVLPAIDVRWWNAGEGRVETAHLDAVVSSARGSRSIPSGQATGGRHGRRALELGRKIVDLVADHWAAPSGNPCLARAGGPRPVYPARWARHRGNSTGGIVRPTHLRSERNSTSRSAPPRRPRWRCQRHPYFTRAKPPGCSASGPRGTIDTLKVTARDPARRTGEGRLAGDAALRQPNSTGAELAAAGHPARRFSQAKTLRKKFVLHQETHAALPSRLEPLESNRLPRLVVSVEETCEDEAAIPKFCGKPARGSASAAQALRCLWAPSGIAAFAQSDPFPSWNDGTAKKSFVRRWPRQGPFGINRFIGCRRIFAFPREIPRRGDRENLQWTTAGGGATTSPSSIIPMRARIRTRRGSKKIGKRLTEALDQATARVSPSST